MPEMTPTLVATRRRARNAEKHLRELVDACLVHLDCLDSLMRQPSTVKRGEQVAQLCNRLDLVTDLARYGALGIDFRRDPAAKTKETARAKRAARGEKP